MRKAAKSKTGRLLVDVDPYLTDLLENIDEGKTEVRLKRGEKIFSQGEPADAIFFIQMGRVKLTVTSSAGKQTFLTMLGPREFAGEGCLVGQAVRIGTATAMETTSLFRIERRSMLRALHAQPKRFEPLTACLLIRNIDLEKNLSARLFNNGERRLARALLKLSRFLVDESPGTAKVPPVSHETLAEISGMTRSRITYFMNKFRRLGLIGDSAGSNVRVELLTDVVLHG